MRKDFKDIMYTVVMERGNCPSYPRGDDPRVFHCDFKVYSIYGIDSAGFVIFEHPEKCSHPVDTIQEARLFMHGEIKWDGCTNFHFDEQDKLMIHMCGRKDMADLATLFDRLYAMADEVMPSTS